MNNITTRIPKRGDIVARKLNSTSGYVYSDKDNVFFVQENFVESEVSSTHEILGVVAWRFHDETLVAYKKNFSGLKWCGRCWWTFTPDLTKSSGTMSIRKSSDWSTTATLTVTPASATVVALVSALNTAFADNTNNPEFVTQDFYAVNNGDNTITIHCNHSSYNQCYNSGGDMLADFKQANFLAGIPALANMKRKNGGTGGAGASASWARYLYYFSNEAAIDLSDSQQASKRPTSVKTTGYPLNKATYLAEGNAQYITALTNVYGTGEAGWLKYMKSCKPIRETDYGNHGIHDGKARGAAYGTKRYTSSKITDSTPMMPASEKCYNLPTYESLTTVYAGDFWLPTTQEMDYIMQDILYGTAGTTGNEDDINSGLNKITGHVHISNGTNYWCGVRYLVHFAWLAHGTRGNFDSNLFYNTYSALPVSLFKIV